MPPPSTAVVVSGSDIVFRIGDQTILNRASFSVHAGERIGIVGRNGAGKSTLLRVIARADVPHAGALNWQRGLTLGWLPQETLLDGGRTVRETILDGARDVLDWLRTYERLPHDSAKALKLEARIAAHDGWDVPRHAVELATRLGAPGLDRAVAELSGGEKRRVALCRALIGNPDLLVLDEPTNHLDTDTIGWLETALLRYPGTVIMVTHDRYFLDRVAGRILEINGGEAYSHPGNYSAFLVAKAAREHHEDRREANRLGFLRREIEWIRRGPKARTTKARSRVDRFHELAAQGPLQREDDIELIVPPAPRLGDRVVELSGVGVRFGERWVFRDVDLLVEPGERIGIVGPNGSGKTTLLHVMLGKLTPTEGTVRVGNRTKFNYVDQERLLLDDDASVIDEVGGGKEFVQLGDETITVWTYLKRFLFTDDRINTVVRCLSGGERNRLLLAKILKSGGNVLVLDEPTNDLDLSTLRVLEEALLRFTGVVLVVSHDRCFLNRVCTGILAFEGDGTLVWQPGDYDYYLQKREERQRERADIDAAAAPAAKRTTPTGPRKLTWKEERELDGMEQAILETEARIAEIEAVFSDPDFFAKHGERTAALAQELKQARSRVTALYDRWDALDRVRRAYDVWRASL